MVTYSKNIAVIRGVKGGFSPDGGKLTGIIKAENYGDCLKIDVTLINFAPLSGGRYVIALSDGVKEIIFDEKGFDGVSKVRTAEGFGAAVCFAVNGEVNVIATAVCGDHLPCVERAINAVLAAEGCGGENDGDVVAEENYHEGKDGKGDEGSGAVCEGEAQEEVLHGGQDENAGGVRKEQKTEVEANSFDDSMGSIEENGSTQEPQGGYEKPQEDYSGQKEGYSGRQADYNKQQAEPIQFAYDTGFYEKVKDEAERIFADYPKCEELESVVEHSRWAKVTYGKGKHYVFGIIYAEDRPAYICYGVPSSNPDKPPQSLKGAAGYIPVQGGGYWVMYQDARTGDSIKIDNI